MFIVLAQARTRLDQEFPASFAEGKAEITGKAIKNAANAKVPESRAIHCPAPGAKEQAKPNNLNILKSGDLKMKNVGELVRTSMQKRNLAIERFRLKQTEFMEAKKQITREIEEARALWASTLKQIPEQPFKY